MRPWLRTTRLRNQGWRASLADKTALIVGYGDIGRDIERRLVPFEVDVLRVARTARDGVHTLAELPGEAGNHTLDLSFSPGTEAYAFTFG